MKNKRKKHSGDKKPSGNDKLLEKALIAGASSFALQGPVSEKKEIKK